MKNRNARLSTFVVCAALAASVVSAQDKAPAPGESKVSKGESLERQLWQDIKAKKWPEVKARIAPGFQSVRADGQRDRAAELEFLKNFKSGRTKLSNFSATQNGNVWIVTYMAAGEEIIDGKKMSLAATPRLSVWQRTDKGYQWVAYASLNVPEPEASATPPAVKP